MRASVSRTGQHGAQPPVHRHNAIAYAVWLAMGSLALAAMPNTAMAQAAAEQAQGARQSYNIPAGSLAPALSSLASTANVLLTFTSEQTRGKTTAGIRGQYTVQEALTALLAQTGLQAVRMDNRGYVLRAAPTPMVVPTAPASNQESTLTVVKVTASAEQHPSELPKPYAGGQIAKGGQVGLLGNKNVMDTPFNQTSYTEQFIKDTQARTLGDVLANDPSVTILETSNIGWEAVRIRGFSTGTDSGSVALNGLYGILPYQSINIGFAERVEVLKGPSVLLNGMPATDAIGGSVNIVSKRATDEPITRLGFGWVSDAQPSVQTDLGRRFGADNQFGIRFNGTWRDGDTAVDPGREKMISGMLGLDFRGDRARVSVDLGHQDWDLKGRNFYITRSSGLSLPSPPSNDRTFFPEWLRSLNSDTFGMIRGDWDIAENLNVYAAYGKRTTDVDEVFSPSEVRNTRGDFRGQARRILTNQEVTSSNAGLRWTAITGPISHQIVVSADQVKSDFSSDASPYTTYNSNIYSPASIAEPTWVMGDTLGATMQKRSSYGIANTMTMLDKKIQLTIGTRRQSVTRIQNTTSTSVNYTSEAWSPAFSLLVKPSNQVSVYANYIEGLRPGTIAGNSFSNRGELFPPYQSKQYEAGVKVDWSNKLTTTLSVYQITQPSTVSVPGSPLPTLSLNGEQRNRGVELNLFGEPARGLRFTGGVAFTEAILTKTQGGTNDGHKAVGVPEWQVSLNGEWDVNTIPGLTLTSRVRRASKTYLDTGNVYSADGWTLWDIGARYVTTSSWNKPVAVRFGIDNALNKNFWTVGTSGAVQSAPRTIRLSATFDF